MTHKSKVQIPSISCGELTGVGEKRQGIVHFATNKGKEIFGGKKLALGPKKFTVRESVSVGTV
jgi:hypothetical protein